MPLLPLHIFIPAIKLNNVSSATSASNGNLYLCDTSAAPFTITLPPPGQNHIIIVKDGAGTFASNNLTVSPNGSELIEGVAGSYTLSQSGEVLTFGSDGTDWFVAAGWNPTPAIVIAALTAQNLRSDFTSLGAITALDTVYLSGPGQVSKGVTSGGGDPSQIFGLSTQTVPTATTVTIQFEGVLGGFVGLTPGARYYANPAVSGGITSTRPTTPPGSTIVQVGYARTSTELGINIQQLGRLGS